MPKLLLLSVSDCFAVYSWIIYFLDPPSTFAPKCMQVIPDTSVRVGRAGTLSFKLDPKAYSDYGSSATLCIAAVYISYYALADASLCESGRIVGVPF